MPIFQEHPELLLAFRRGEPSALDAVYRRYVSDVLRLLRAGFMSGGKRLGAITDPQALLDAVQDVFVRAFGQSGRLGYDGIRPYRTYLLRIAQNLRIDQLRKTGREVLLDSSNVQEQDLLDLDSLLQSGQAVPALPASEEWLELQAAVREYVSGLDAQAQRFVELRFVEELGQVEVAARLSVTRRRVRTLEAGILSGLRRALEEQGLS